LASVGVVTMSPLNGSTDQNDEIRNRASEPR